MVQTFFNMACQFATGMSQEAQNLFALIEKYNAFML